MSKTEKDMSEKNFQENFVKELEKYKWKALEDLNGNTHKVTVDDLVAFWRSELNRINADQLEGVALTDNEFQQVMSKVNLIANSYEAAKILAAENSVGKIDGIYRDDNPKVTRKQITLTIFRKAEVRGGDSSYSIAREVWTKNNNRFDIVLLINGLPLINIEQKRTDKNLMEAYYQFKRYYKEGEYCNNFMAFSQMMVVTSEIETMYFATPKSLLDFNPAFLFHWSDKTNIPINNYREIVKNFLMIPMAHQMVGDYLVIDEAEREEDRRHLLLRPYQVYALRAIEGAARGYDNKDKIPHGGYIWHTTGSGKTVTSFKTALFLATRGGFDKVVFLVDRKELDSNTVKMFKEYAKYEPVEVDETPYSYKLRDHFKASSSAIIVTTTHKLSELVKECVKQDDYSIAEKKIIFIVDEAHRTTMGKMMQVIKDYFRKNGLFYGFTGTPLFDENMAKGRINEENELIRTTEKLFGKCLHKYTIDSAIADKNVLGFQIDYINTGEFESYEKLREQIVEKRGLEKTELRRLDIERQVMRLSDLEVEKEAVERGLLIYQDETHIPKVVSTILENWEEQSQEGYFNALLTAKYKKRVVAYYHELKKQMKEKGIQLNVAMTFSIGNENVGGVDDADDAQVSDEILEEMLSDYKNFTNLDLCVEDLKSSRKNPYFEDLIERAKRGGSGRNKKNVDLVIVADQLLTGYDSKRLNTLYVDRTLELQSLVQAYSRTNRLFGKEKEFGTIVNFQYPEITKENVEEALRLYGSGGGSNTIIKEEYSVAVLRFQNLLMELQRTLTNPSDWMMLENKEMERKAFFKSYLAAAMQFNTLSQYYKYKWDDDKFGMDEHSWNMYTGAYRNLIRNSTSQGGETEAFIRPIGKSKLVRTDIVDAAYIIKLIGTKVQNADGVQSVDDETLRIIHEQIQELSNMGESIKAELLKAFVDTELINGKVTASIPFDEAFDRWCKAEMNKEINALSNKWGINSELLCKSVAAYDILEAEEIPYMQELIESLDFESALEKAENVLLHNMNLIATLPKAMKELKERYL